MGKKSKDKAKTAEKKAAKAEKQLKKSSKKSKKDGNLDDFEDLEELLNKFQESDKKLTTVSETKINQPGIRSSASITASPISDEIYLFGGEHNSGNKTFVYNDLFVFNIKKQEWTKLFIPNPPPPRCAHQAVITPNDGGQLWIFGGEFSSQNGNQFYHYKDLWCLNLKTRVWEEITGKQMKNGPSARSGHRMVYYQEKKEIYVFGGFNERITEFVYYNDLFSFSVENRSWKRVVASNDKLGAPGPRSACQFISLKRGLN